MAASGMGTSPISVASGRALDSCGVTCFFRKPASTPDRFRGRVPLAAYFCRPTPLRFVARESQTDQFCANQQLAKYKPQGRLANRTWGEVETSAISALNTRSMPLQLISESGNCGQQVTGAGNAPEGTG
jgi:hypothetical protein